MNVFTTPLVATLAALALVAACSDEDRRELGEVDLRDSLTNQVTDAVAAQDLELDGDLQCTATIATDGTASAACSGTTTSGDAVEGTYAGTADIDAETCTADLAIAVAGQAPDETSAVDCFDVG